MDWDTTGLRKNGTGTHVDGDTMGLKLNGTGTQWDQDKKTSYFALPEKKAVNNYYYSLPMVTFEWSVLAPFLSARAK